MKRFLKKLMFGYHMAKMKYVVRTTNNMFSYPLLMDLEFNRDWYRDRYLDRGISVHDSCQNKLKQIHRKMKRAMSPEELRADVYERLIGYRQFKSNTDFIDRMFKEHPELKEE